MTRRRKEFVHLHLHSDYSLLDGACKIEPLIQQAVSYRMPALALTDHGNLFAAVQFHDQAVKNAIKPILGCEVYLARGSRFDRSGRSDNANHLILLAENRTGYQNLVRLVSLGYLEGFYYRPRIDRELLARHHEGLIALSACLKGSIPSLLLSDEGHKALHAAGELREIMGPDHFFLELQDHNLDAQKRVNPDLLQLASSTGIPLVATNDCHYLRSEDYEAHDVLLCIQTGKTLNEEGRLRYTSNQFYFKSPDEMWDLFGSVPEALHNTLAIAERCNVRFDDSVLHLPDYHVPGGETLDAHFERMVREGFAQRLPKLQELSEQHRLRFPLSVYQERLDFEIAMIRKMGLAGYFLIVWDFIRFARDNGIPVGPGRGSAAGSLASFALRITDLDPIQYSLLFERFLNPERISMPDIDIDFCMRRRAEVIEYVTRKYGRDNVSQIITFGTMAARSAVRDVGRSLEISYSDVDRIAKMIPFERNASVERALENDSNLQELAKDPRVGKMLRIAQRLEGVARHASTHAAGVVITPQPLIQLVPLFKSAKDEIMTQYPMTDLERMGLLKMDFLALATLTVIDDTVKAIARQKQFDLHLEELALDDSETYRLFADGRTDGIFQFESSGMKESLRRVKPERFEDLIALNALYRPGPMSFIEEYARRKQGQTSWHYELPELEPILQETYGIIVYQEQVMQIASRIAGFSLAEADILRKAMGKKKLEVMRAQQKKFLSGAQANGFSEATAQKIFEMMERFAEYGFNKSHSTAYALLAYQTGYLKVHYPVQFMAALLSIEIGNTEKIVQYVNECRNMGIRILPPDINRSDIHFAAEGDHIRFGLVAIRNAGESAIRSILERRNSEGSFRTFTDFCEKVDHRTVNKRVVDSLIKAGCFDALGYRRAPLLESLESIVDSAQKIQRDRQSGQKDLFGGNYGAMLSSAIPEDIPDIAEWSESVRLAFEKEALGFYLTGHPLQRFEATLRQCSQWTIQSVKESDSGTEVAVGGVVTAPRYVKTKKGDTMCVFVLEDLTSSLEVVVFPALFTRRRDLLDADKPVLIRGKFEHENESNPKIIAAEIETVDGLKERTARSLLISAPVEQLPENAAEELIRLFQDNAGECGVIFELFAGHCRKVRIESEAFVRIRPSAALVEQIENICGKGAVRLYH